MLTRVSRRSFISVRSQILNRLKDKYEPIRSVQVSRTSSEAVGAKNKKGRKKSTCLCSLRRISSSSSSTAGCHAPLRQADKCNRCLTDFLPQLNKKSAVASSRVFVRAVKATQFTGEGKRTRDNCVFVFYHFPVLHR